MKFRDPKKLKGRHVALRRKFFEKFPTKSHIGRKTLRGDHLGSKNVFPKLKQGENWKGVLCETVISGPFGVKYLILQKKSGNLPLLESVTLSSKSAD